MAKTSVGWSVALLYSQIRRRLTDKMDVHWNNPKRIAVPAIFGVWLILATVAASTLTAWHTISLPSTLKNAAASGDRIVGWRVRHYLSAECACSRAVAAYLATRGPMDVAREDVVLIASGDSEKDGVFGKTLRDKGFAVEVVTEETAASTAGVEGVPALEILAPDQRIAFRGGYRERGAAPGMYLDRAILSDLMVAKPVRVLPIYGCATSARLRNLMDPFGLKGLN